MWQKKIVASFFARSSKDGDLRTKRPPLVSKSPELNVAAKVLYECWVTGLVAETMSLETTQDERENR